MIREYAKFFLNGGMLGLAAWGLQLLIYKAIGSDSSLSYALASALTYIPLVCINFLIQRAWIFNRPGLFPRFVLANLSIMLLVTILSPGFRQLIDLLFGPPWGSRCGFALAAVVGSVPSFLIKRAWVFGRALPNRGSGTPKGADN